MTLASNLFKQRPDGVTASEAGDCHVGCCYIRPTVLVGAVRSTRNVADRHIECWDNVTTVLRGAQYTHC